MADALKLTVATDWRRCRRGVLWSSCLATLAEPAVDVREFGVADEPERLAEAGDDPFLIEHLDGTDVLVVNWDAVNGDPDFGADFARRWFEHRRLEVLAWVAAGGVLVVEGQATLGVPSQVAYDAVLDVGEVGVCGPEDALRPNLQRRRYGHRCRLTKRAYRSEVFRDLASPELDSTGVARAYEEMLPPPADRVLTRRLRELDWNMMYRGWFRSDPVRGRRLRWVALVRTADRRWWTGRFNHPVMLGAQHGRGAIFVSTMFLASSGQAQLIRCLLTAGDGAGTMPVRGGVVRPVAEFVRKNAVPVVAGLVAAPVVGAARDWDDTGLLAKLTQAAAVVLAFVVVGLLTRVLHGAVRLVKEMLGW